MDRPSCPLPEMMRSRLYTFEYFKVMVVFFLLFGSLTLFYLLPIYIETIGGSRLMIGIIMGSCEVAAVASRLLFGKGMDRVGRKKVLLGGALLTMISCFLFLLVDSAGVLPILLRILLGVGYGAFFTASFTIVADLSPPERLAEGLGTFGIAAMISQGVGPWLGEWLLHRYGFEAVFIAGGIFALAALLIALSVRESTSPDFCLTYDIGYRSTLRGGGLAYILIITFLYAAGRGAIISFFSDFAYDMRFGRIWLFFVAFSAAAVSTRVFAGKIVDRVGRLRMLVPSILLFAVGLFSIALIRSERGLIVVGVLCGLGQSFLYPVLMSLALGHSTVCDRGLTTGMFTAVFDAGLGFGSFFWGAVSSAFTYPVMYVAASVAAASGILWRGSISSSFSPTVTRGRAEDSAS